MLLVSPVPHWFLPDLPRPLRRGAWMLVMVVGVFALAALVFPLIGPDGVLAELDPRLALAIGALALIGCMIGGAALMDHFKRRAPPPSP